VGRPTEFRLVRGRNEPTTAPRVGRLLMNRVALRAAAEKRRLTVNTSVENSFAQQLYEAIGYGRFTDHDPRVE
jgi:hypothetical protein